jgi:hypothetical protein
MAEKLTTAPMLPPGSSNLNRPVGETLKAPPRPMQPRPSLVVGGPAYFTPEGYQAPVQPEQAFMPTDTRPDPIGENFRRQYPDRPMPPPPMPTPQPQPEPPFVPGPITGQPVYPDPIPAPAPQPEYDPYAQSDLGKRALGGEYIDSMNFHWFDPTTGEGGSTTEGWSRVPDSAKGYTYLNKEEAEKAKQKFMSFEDRGTTPEVGSTPITAPAPAPVETVGAGFDPTQGGTLPGGYTTMPSIIGEGNLTDMRARGPGEAKLAVEPDSYFPMPSPMKPITLPSGQTVQIPDIDMEQIQASLAGLNIPGKSVPLAPMMPAVPPMMPAALDVAPVAPPSLAPRMPPMMPSLSPKADRRRRDPRFER